MLCFSNHEKYFLSNILTDTNKSFKIVLKTMTYNLQKWLFKINVYISTKMVDVSLYTDSIFIGTLIFLNKDILTHIILD
jgi:hypothetical protein